VTNIDLVQLHRAVLADATAYVSHVSDDDLQRSTPCAGWDLRQLLDHMVGQHLGFARVVRTGTAPADAYRPVPFTPTAWRTSVDEMLAAFARADLEARVVEVELEPVRPLPVSFLLTAQILDTVVHTWDVAAALGEPFTPGPVETDFVLRVATSIPDDDRRDRPCAAFAHARDTQGTPWEQALGALGRDPGWAPPSSPRPRSYGRAGRRA
jgi:uncharacterized protein (TIGR03086 family)